MINTELRELLLKIHPIKTRMEIYEFIIKIKKGGKNGHS